MELQIVTATDAHYFRHMLVMLASLASRNIEHRLSVTALVTPDAMVDREAEARLRRQFPHLTLRYVEIDGREFADFRLDTYITLASYFRLFIVEALPLSVSRVIYLDPDVVVLDDVSELALLPLDQAVLAGVDLRMHQASRAALGFAPGELYLNAGILVINLEAWRARYDRGATIAFVRANHARLRYHDQDALNMLFRGALKELDPKWNVNTDIIRCAFRQDYLPEAADDWSEAYGAWCRRAIADRVILHYSGPSKPWNQHGAYPFQDEYWSVAETLGLGRRPDPGLSPWGSLAGAGPVWVYGAGRGGRIVRRRLLDASVEVAGYLDTFRSGEEGGVPVVRWSDFAGGGPIVIASEFWPEILPRLRQAPDRAPTVYLGYPYLEAGIFRQV